MRHPTLHSMVAQLIPVEQKTVYNDQDFVHIRRQHSSVLNQSKTTLQTVLNGSYQSFSKENEPEDDL